MSERVNRLLEMQAAAEKRLDRLEAALSLAAPRPRSRGSAVAGSRWAPVGADQPDLCPTHARLRAELLDRKVNIFKFALVPDDYYDQSLGHRCFP